MSRSLLAALLALQAALGAAFRVVEYEDLDSPLRVIVGVPGSRVQQREYIQEMVKEHVAARSSSGALALDYAFISDEDDRFGLLFPKHVGDGALAVPSLRLMNTKTGDFMCPDWEIPARDFASELDRLVNEFIKWQGQTDEIESDDDGVIMLHSKNLPSARLEHDNLLVMFYAPWCKYSQAMLPKFAAAKELVDRLVQEQVLPKDAAVGKVNVDEEGQLRRDFNISMFPSFRFLQAGAAPTNFRGQAETTTDLVAHFITAARGGQTVGTAREATAFTTAVAGLNKVLASDPEVEESSATVVLAVTSSSENALGPCPLVKAIQGKTTIATCVAPSLARQLVVDGLVPLFPSVPPPSPTLELKEGQVLVLTESNGLLASNVFSGSQDDLARWTMAATWPTVSRFDGSASQGDRIRNSPITTLILLAAEEQDFMFPEFKAALAATAADRRGHAHFLFADRSEPRIQGILGSAGATSSFPAAVFLSLSGEFEPIVLTQEDVNKEKMVRTLDSVLQLAEDGGPFSRSAGEL